MIFRLIWLRFAVSCSDVRLSALSVGSVPSVPLAPAPGTPRPRATAPRLPEDEPDRARRAELGHLDGDEMAARDLGERAPPRQHRDPEAHLHGALDAVEAGQRNLDVDRRVAALVQPEHAIAGRRRVVVGDDGLAPDFFDASRASSWRARCFGLASITSSSLPSEIDCSPLSGGWNVSTPKSRLCSSSSAAICRDGHAADLDPRLRVQPREPLDDRQDGVHGGLVGPEDDAAAAHLLELADGRLRLRGQPQQPLRRARGAARPASVSVPLRDERSNSLSPSSSSRRRIAWLMAGCVRCSRLAAFEKLRSAATATKAFKS